MKIVIDIPEKTVNEIKDNVMFADNISSDIRWDVTNAIVNGTPLDDVKSEIMDKAFKDANATGFIFLGRLWKILDNIGKEREE